MNTISALTVARTVRLHPAVEEALSREADEQAREPADYMAEILTRHVSASIAAKNRALAARLEAEMRVKTATAKISSKLAMAGIAPDHTLLVFKAIRESDALRADYLLATGCKTGLEAGIPAKHQLNLYLGAISKRAAGAVSQTLNGKPVMIRNIKNEFCGSVTALQAP